MEIDTNAEEQQQDPSEPVLTPEVLLSIIQGALQHGHASVSEHQQKLQSFEEKSPKYYLSFLLKIVTSYELSEDVRLLAAVLAKNLCSTGNYKRLSGRPWNKFTGPEKADVRPRLLPALEADPSERVTAQLLVLISNIASFDFPMDYPDLLETLLAWAEGHGGQELDWRKKIRALKALKHVGRALQERRLVLGRIDGFGLFSHGHGMMKLLEQAQQEKKAIHQQLGPCLTRLLSVWGQNYSAFKASQFQHQLCGQAALYALSGLAQVFPAYSNTMSQPYRVELQCDFWPLVEAATDVCGLQPAELGQDSDRRTSLGICSRMFERTTKMITVLMEYLPHRLANHMAIIFKLYVTQSLLQPSAADIQRWRPKRVQIMQHLLGFCLLLSESPQALKGPNAERHEDSAASINDFITAVGEVCGGSQCLQILAALLSKYLTLTDDELSLWQEDPEEYFQNSDTSSSYESSERRALALALLGHILQKSEEKVIAALKELLDGLGRAQATPSSVLLQEACYLAIGHCLTKLMLTVSHTDTLQLWYTETLKLQIQNPSRPEDASVHYRALRRRALWVVQVNDIPTEMVQGVIDTVIPNLGHGDLVVALQAISTLTAIFVRVCQEIQSIAVEEESMAAFGTRLIFPSLQGQTEKYEPIAQHVAAIAPGLLQSVLAVQERLKEVESHTEVLTLVALLLELVGKRAPEVVLSIANMWHQAWSQAFKNQAKFEKGAAARLQSTIMELFIDLVQCLGSELSQKPQILAATQAMLSQSLSIGWNDNPESMESGLHLLTTLLTLETGNGENYRALIPRLMEIMAQGKNDAAVFQVIMHFIVLSGPDYQELLQPLLPKLLNETHIRLTAAYNAAVSAYITTDKANGSSTTPSSVSQTASLRGIRPFSAHHLAVRSYMGAPDDVGVIDSDILESMNEACSLLQILLVLRLDDSLLESHIRFCALISCTSEFEAQHLLQKPLETVQRALFHSPEYFSRTLLSGGLETVFLERTHLCVRRRYVADFSTPIEAVIRLARSTRHLVAACLCSVGLKRSLPQMRQEPFVGQNMMLVLEGLEEAPSYNRHVEAMQVAVNAGGESHFMRQSQRLSLQDALFTCDVRQIGQQYVKSVIDDPDCTQFIHASLLTVLNRVMKDIEKENVSKQDIQDLMAQLGQATL